MKWAASMLSKPQDGRNRANPHETVAEPKNKDSLPAGRHETVILLCYERALTVGSFTAPM